MKSSAESTHLDGVFLSVKNAMRRAGGGSIIMTSSVAGLRESAGLAGYCATKGGVRLFATYHLPGLTSGRARPDVPFSLGPFTGLSCEITALTNLSLILLRA